MRLDILFFLVFASSILYASCDDDDDTSPEFENYRKKFFKKYKDRKEEKAREGKIKDKLKKIKAHNKQYEKGERKFKLGLNEFSDLDFDEFVNTYTGLIEVILPDNQELLEKKSKPRFGSINQIDWRLSGVVTPVKNQGACGSCWAFAATGALESRWAIKYTRLPNLSEQNLLDCSGSFDCSGGIVYFAYQYIQANGGVNNQTVYPYEAVKRSCRYQAVFKETPIISQTIYVRRNETILEMAVDEGPVAASVTVSEAFVNYETGVLELSACPSDQPTNHAVVIVGYNNTAKPSYWIIKNSWGPRWGENGYIRIQKDVNACNIIRQVFIPRV